MKFGNWFDRLTYVVAEAQILVAGVVFSIGAALVIFRPTLPAVPPVAVGMLAATLLFGPALFGFFVWLVQKLRTRNMIEVHHVNAVQDVLEKYYVEPEIWREKAITGPNPYPVNGGGAWAVQEFEWLEDIEELRVKGIWLEETTDTKLLTSKSHMQAIYGKLTESHITLNILRDSVSEFGADIQRALINSMAEARERGKLMDKSAVKDVFESFEDDAAGTTDDDLPTLEPDDLPGEDLGDLADDALEDTPTPDVGMGSGPHRAATDGGSE
ncbi:hypothetical protein EA462_15415 [Natrarchaeobius halalkaliphilus]|uniref:Uncharacterized protein n=1 Tax=Natrarchaeobius halalkaliphilus TaxID=1679091 RepID=A0A3N6LIJ4_9EURY|nr:hypothetical protein [Natrarchaeobius halalkaliphilus]RQG87029.1 hypothetical protein EA462_15415 [Natrarchaeobius halalkaliphilus]